MSRWKDFSDRPDDSCRVLWLYKVAHPKSWGYAVASGRWHKMEDGRLAYQEDFESDEDYGKPTHWMPLPPPPQEET